MDKESALSLLSLSIKQTLQLITAIINTSQDKNITSHLDNNKRTRHPFFIE